MTQKKLKTIFHSGGSRVPGVVPGVVNHYNGVQLDH